MARKGSTARRGYGWKHQQLRKRWQRSVDAAIVNCARCGYLIEPGELWDLGHDDLDRNSYQGPEHRRCNRATAGRNSRRRSRVW